MDFLTRKEAIASIKSLFKSYEICDIDDYKTDDLIADIEDSLNECFTVDAEPVVRCKNCNHYQRDGHLEGFGWCYFHRHVFSDNDFCSSAKMDEK